MQNVVNDFISDTAENDDAKNSCNHHLDRIQFSRQIHHPILI